MGGRAPADHLARCSAQLGQQRPQRVLPNTENGEVRSETARWRVARPPQSRSRRTVEPTDQDGPGRGYSPKLDRDNDGVACE
ncbi:hypothetical protein C7H75_25255 (plasmid) [Prescottella equi]|nr:hypothetical protein C7H75_25255 [Prescottella equi]